MNQLEEFEKGICEKLPGYGRIPTFRPGDTVKVSVKIKEGNREREQVFDGVCIARKNRGIHSSFRVRKILAGEGVERVFPLYSPLISIERVREGVVRRAKLYYLRDRQGKRARIPEKKYFSEKTKLKAQAALDLKAKETSSKNKLDTTPKTTPEAGSETKDTKA